MSNTGKVRHAHEIIDDIADGYTPDHDDLETLRSFLPDLPAQKTLEELRLEVYDAWIGTDCNEWPEDAYGVLETWLWELHKQLEGLTGTAPESSQASPKLPEGMRLAEHEEYGRVVVSPGVGIYRRHEIFYLDPGMISGTDIREVEPDSLTFIDSEPAAPAHPEFLETEADYENAPEGTIVVSDGGVPCHKFQSKWSSVAFLAMKDDRGMSRACRRVLRWGNE